MHRYTALCKGASVTPDLARRLFAGILCLTTAAHMVRAGEIYKSVDADGKVVYSDHLDPSMSQSTLVQLEDPQAPPSQLHFCWTNCFTLVLDNGVYRRTDGTDESWTVETFSTNAIVLHRHDAPTDWNGYSRDVVYAGQVSNDRLIGVTVNGKAVSGIDASWGAALNTLPGSNAERDAKSTASDNSSSAVTLSSAAPPPPLPVEDQPTLSEEGSLWTPGYWYPRDQQFVWIPGAWVQPPRVGFLWTPAYWGSAGTVFVFHPGSWGTTVGFYGGVNYGYGYFGNGYTGGHWIGNSFAYNSAVNHVDPSVAHHTYAEGVPGQNSRGTVSYSGAPRSGNSIGTPPQHQPAPVRAVPARAVPVRAAMNPGARTVERTEETAPVPTKVDRPPAANAAAAVAPPKPNHVTLTRAEPIKP
jgi:Domain of unknown function (DUF4124)/WXXGXW repeat (2 copies)